MTAYKTLLAALIGAGAVSTSPLRYVTAGNQFQQTTKTFSGALLGNAYKNMDFVGADCNYLIVSHTNAALGQTSFSAFTVPELWITIDGQSTGYQVTWGGLTSTTVPAGAADFQSDPIPISSIPGSVGGILPRGTKIWIGGRTEAAVNAIIPGIIHRNPATNSALQYTPGSTTVSNLQGSSAISAVPGAGTQATANQAYGLPTLIGRFVGGDKPVHGAIGDSITMGYFSSAQTYSPGAFYRGLFDNFATFSNPRPGIVIARVGSNATDWSANGTVTAALAVAVTRANVFYERFGANFILNDGGSTGAANLIASRKSNVWDFIRAHPAATGRAPIIYGLAVLPHVQGIAFTGISGDGTNATITGLPTSFAASIGSTGATKTGCAVAGVTPTGYNVNAASPATTTFTVQSTTSVSYPNTTTATATVFGTASDGFTTTTNMVTFPGCAQGQESDFLNTQMAAIAGTAGGPDFYVDVDGAYRQSTNSTLPTWFLALVNMTVEGLHPNDTNGYPAVAAGYRALIAAVV